MRAKKDYSQELYVLSQAEASELWDEQVRAEDSALEEADFEEQLGFDKKHPAYKLRERPDKDD